MGRIYRSTEEALVWLGPAYENSDALMDVFLKLGAFAEAFNLLGYYSKEKYQELEAIQTKKNPDDPKTIEYHAFCDSITHLFTYNIFKSLTAFHHRPWFRRA
ncbi:hypothetical protein BCR34DRAFT_583694 [Clohesyomyces aquaticus]|uniref:Heterokaryon incompatibility domain-containing protein n=1 Tax=Clohesyomyces aquaticus TaxID=1231657 RepID=A0A1Y2A3W7_9PLEO|nr:hypothetical protein BCR34DRAFT_583694 [Clohesyomyces aquaticus]